MKPTTRLESRRNQERPRTRLQVRRMDPSIFNKYSHIPPYNTRSSPKKKATGKEVAGRVSWKWDDERRVMFFTLCVEEVQNGKRSGASLKPESWKRIAQELSTHFGASCVETQVKNFWTIQKGFWSIANSLRNATGLGFDPTNECFSADEEWWSEAIKAIPDVKTIRNKNIVELLYYGDMLFKSITATGEHVTYPSTACEQQDVTDLTRRLDLNVDPNGGEGASYFAPSNGTPGSSSTVGSKRKSGGAGSARSRKKQAHSGRELMGAFENAIEGKLLKEQNAEDRDSCMPFLNEIMEYSEELFMYGTTLLASNEKYVKAFLRMESMARKIRWLMYMQRKVVL